MHCLNRRVGGVNSSGAAGRPRAKAERRRILKVLKGAKDGMSPAKLAKTAGVDPHYFTARTRILIGEGKICRDGRSRWATYRIAGPPAKPPAATRLPSNPTKNAHRKLLQMEAMSHMKALGRGRALRAIALPGDRPEEEVELLKTGFGGTCISDVVMVEKDARLAERHAANGVVHGDFFEVLREQSEEGGPFTVVDMDCCNSPSYREYDELASLLNNGYVTRPCCIRLTACLRSGRGGVAQDLEHLSKRISDGRKVLSFSSPTYVGGDGKSGPPMQILQWIIR